MHWKRWTAAAVFSFAFGQPALPGGWAEAQDLFSACGAESPVAGLVSVAGRSGPGDSTAGLYILEVKHRHQAALPQVDAIEVRSEPSGTLLLAASTAIAKGSLGDGPGVSRYRIDLPFVPPNSERIVVTLQIGSSRIVLSDALVHGTEFETTSIYTIRQPTAGRRFELDIRHCCSGGPCGRQCVTCNGPWRPVT